MKFSYFFYATIRFRQTRTYHDLFSSYAVSFFRCYRPQQTRVNNFLRHRKWNTPENIIIHPHVIMRNKIQRCETPEYFHNSMTCSRYESWRSIYVFDQFLASYPRLCHSWSWNLSVNDFYLNNKVGPKFIPLLNWKTCNSHLMLLMRLCEQLSFTFCRKVNLLQSNGHLNWLSHTSFKQHSEFILVSYAGSSQRSLNLDTVNNTHPM